MPRRVTRHRNPPPLAQRNGIDAIHYKLPDPLPAEYGEKTPTIADFLIAKFCPDTPETMLSRYRRKEVLDDHGNPLSPLAPYEPGKGIWYYRELKEEPELSNDLPVLYEDEHLLAIDKPHFLPTTPRGAYVAQTALTKLRVRENNPQLIPIHRLDRPTAGVLLFAKTLEARAPFQTMFQGRAVHKTYLAIAPAIPHLPVAASLEISGRIEKYHRELQVRFLDTAQTHAAGKEINSHTTVECIKSWANTQHPPADTTKNQLIFPAQGEKICLYQLTPHTGKTHQLRAHLNHLGAPIYGDVQYPTVLPPAPDRAEQPLQLLAQALNFTHPITHQHLTITSKRALTLVEETTLNTSE